MASSARGRADDEALKGHAPAVASEAPPSAPSKLDALLTATDRTDRYTAWLVLLAALFTRFYLLPQPDGVVFDESHFGRFTNQYTARTYFFDIHPPLGKLVFWLMGQVVGYNHPPGQNPAHRPYLGLPSDCKYEHISEDYGPECKYVYLRVVSAFHSSLTVMLMYLIGRRWSGHSWGGLLTGGLLLFDMLNHIEGRLILMDVQLIFWCTMSLWAAIQWWDRLNEDADAEAAEAAGAPPPPEAPPLGFFAALVAPLGGRVARRLEGWERVRWAVWVGVCCGNAISVKMTGLATPAVIGMESALALWFLKRPAQWRDLFTVLFTAATLYTAYFAQHFYLLTRHGDGDAEFMDMVFQKTIKENPNYEEGAKWAGFFRTMIDLNIRMVVHNANILEPHPWQSRWNEWMFNKRGVSYYGKDLPLTYTAHMYLIGNHAIHWSVVLVLGLFVVLTLFYLRYRNVPRFSEWLGNFKGYFAQCSFCLMVYFVNMAPYVAVARSTFCYHYMPALVYGELMVARTIDLLAGPRWRVTATKVYLAIIGLVWFHYTPWIVRNPALWGPRIVPSRKPHPPPPPPSFLSAVRLPAYQRRPRAPPVGAPLELRTGEGGVGVGGAG
jgi:dolichyl-phosphate-mannose--protein O-mannosyl transferase